MDNNATSMMKKIINVKKQALDTMLDYRILAEEAGTANLTPLKEIAVNTGVPLWKVRVEYQLKKVKYFLMSIPTPG